jgi:hypothetical protein
VLLVLSLNETTQRLSCVVFTIIPSYRTEPLKATLTNTELLDKIDFEYIFCVKTEVSFEGLGHPVSTQECTFGLTLNGTIGDSGGNLVVRKSMDGVQLEVHESNEVQTEHLEINVERPGPDVQLNINTQNDTLFYGQKAEIELAAESPYVVKIEKMTVIDENSSDAELQNGIELTGQYVELPDVYGSTSTANFSLPIIVYHSSFMSGSMPSLEVSYAWQYTEQGDDNNGKDKEKKDDRRHGRHLRTRHISSKRASLRRPL